MSIQKSKILLLFDIFKNYSHFLVISVVLLCLGINRWYFLIVYLIYVFWLFSKVRRLAYLMIVINLIFIINYVVRDLIYYNSSNNNISGFVESITYKEYNNQLLIKTKNGKYLVKTKDLYDVGDCLKINGSLEKYVIHYPNQFDYSNYLHYQNIKGVIANAKIEKVGHQFTISYLHHTIKQHISNTFPKKYAAYINTLTIGSDDFLDSTNIDKIGISHLFVISGLHVSILILIVSKILKLLKIKNKTNKFIIIVVIGIYVILTNFLISVLRVFINLIIKEFTNLTSLDRISLNFLIVTLINPYITFSLSFILSYFIAFFMSLYNNPINIQFKHIFLTKFINYVLNTFILTLLVQLLVLPIVISINPDFNLISVLVNPLFIIFVTYLYLPISFIVLIIPQLLPLYELITSIFEYLTQNFSNIAFLSISLGNIHIVFKMLYYVGFYLFMVGVETKKYKYLLVLFVLMFIWYHKGLFRLNDEVYFLDLPVGEATVIISKCTNNVIVIDSGEATKDHAFTKILKNFGIKSVDYLIISHSDSDHIGGAINMIKYIKVKNLILNYYDKNNLTSNLANYATNTYYLKNKDQIKTNYFELLVLSPNLDYKNINDNSLVFILKIKDTNFLFTGDISTKVEKVIIKEYQKINVDYLKIAHHGSKTSSSIEFLTSINYRYAVVMNGYYNTFGFPIKEVMNRIPKNKQLITKNIGTIILKLEKNKFVLKKLTK